MKVETSRRKFLQGTVAMSIVGGTTIGSLSILAAENHQRKKYTVTTKTGVDKNINEVATLCEMCVNKCAAVARVEDGVVTKLDPNPRFPKSRNMLCPRGNAGIQALYDPDRLKYPMIRVGKKGEGKFKQVSWEEAYKAIWNGTDQFIGMEKILEEEKDNRSTFLFCAGEGMAEHTFKQFYNAFGSANWLNHATLCLQTVVSGYAVTLGAYPAADLENTEYIIMAGANRAEAIMTPDTMDCFKRTKGKGAKLIYVDPRFTHTAAKADKWLAIYPGTDLAFVLALTYVVISEELYDTAYVLNNFQGFDEYKHSILSNNYTPEWASKITGIKVKDIYKVAREFMAHAPKAIYYPGRRSTFSTNDFQLRRATAIFQALGGGIDTKGGLVFGKKLKLGEHEVVEPLYAQAKESAGSSWIVWRNRLLEEKMPYPVRGMFIYKHNPMQNTPNSAKTAQMLKKMELVVAIDTMPSDTVMYADVVLPECTYLERTDPVKSFGGIEPSIAQRNRVIDPMFETKPVIEILKGLTEKISKPLFEITKKYDEDVQEELESLGEGKTKMTVAAKEAEVFAEFDIAQPFIHSQEEINKEMVEGIYGKEAVEALRKYGVYYPNMQKWYKQLSLNSFQYYPEKKKYYQVNNGKAKTGSKKIICNIPNLEKKGTEAMPIWKDEYLFNVPEGKFKLLTGRHAQFTQSGTSNNAVLRDLIIENYIWINKRVATDLGIAFGDSIEVSSSAGTTELKAYPTEKVGPKTLFFVHGFGDDNSALTWAYKNGGNDNAVIEDHVEPVYGAAAMHATNVEIRKV